MATISERIVEGLRIRKLKQTDLVKLTGIGKSSISTYIAGNYEPKQKNIYKIAKALNVSESWLMGYDVPMQRNVIASTTTTLYNVHCETKAESELILSYRELSNYGKNRVSSYANGVLRIEKEEAEVNAAHALPNASAEDKKHDDDIMNDDCF